MGLLAASDTQRSDVRPLLSLGKILHPLITIVGKRRRDQLEKSSSIWLSIPPSTLISPPIRRREGDGCRTPPKTSSLFFFDSRIDACSCERGVTMKVMLHLSPSPFFLSLLKSVARLAAQRKTGTFPPPSCLGNKPR